jgi:hypothetical protein
MALESPPFSCATPLFEHEVPSCRAADQPPPVVRSHTLGPSPFSAMDSTPAVQKTTEDEKAAHAKGDRQ